MSRGMKVMVDPGFPDHRKVRALGRILRIHPMQAAGHVLALWCRVMKECPSGDIRAWDAHDIADAAKWDGDAEALVEALRSREIRFLERYKVHDWTEEQGNVVLKRKTWAEERAERRRKEAERKALEAKSREVSGADKDADKDAVRGGQVSGADKADVSPSYPILSYPILSEQQQHQSNPPPAVAAGDQRARVDASTRVEGPSEDGDGPASGVAAAAGGNGQEDKDGSPRPSPLDGIHPRHGAALLVDVGFQEPTARSLATLAPIGRLLGIVHHARTKSNPAGWARDAIDGGWVYEAPEAERQALEAELLEERRRIEKRFERPKHTPLVERQPGESDADRWARLKKAKRAEQIRLGHIAPTAEDEVPPSDGAQAAPAGGGA